MAGGAEPLGKPALYLQLVGALRKEPAVSREVAKLQDDAHDLLERRREEEGRLRRDRGLHRDAAEQHYLQEEYNEALYQYTKEKKKHDHVLYTVEKLYLSLPLTAEEAEAVYGSIVAEFCDSADARLAQVERQHAQVEADYGRFRGREGAAWDEARFQEATGCAYGLFLCTGMRCDALCRSLSARYLHLKRSLHDDARLASFVHHS